jgi:hypothetical protein
MRGTMTTARRISAIGAILEADLCARLSPDDRAARVAQQAAEPATAKAEKARMNALLAEIQAREKEARKALEAKQAAYAQRIDAHRAKRAALLAAAKVGLKAHLCVQ